MHMVDMLDKEHLWLSSGDCSMWLSCWLMMYMVDMKHVVVMLDIDAYGGYAG